MWKPIKEFQIGFVGWLGGSNNDFSSFKPSLRQANKHKNSEAKRFTYMACQFKGNNVHSAYLCVLLTLLLTSMGQCLWAKDGVLLDSLTCFCIRTVIQKYRSLFGCVSSHQRSVSVLCGKRVSSCSQMSVFALVCKVWVEVQDESACQWWDYDTAHIRCLPALRSVFISWIRVDAASVECRVQESRRLI